MKYPKPIHVVNAVYQDPQGAYRYRASNAIPKANHGKLVPQYLRQSGNISLVFANYNVPLELYQQFLDATAHIPYDATYVPLPSMDAEAMMTERSLDRLNRLKSREDEDGMKGQLIWTIGEYYKVLPDAKKIAAMFMVGDYLVNSALRTRRLGPYAEDYTEPPKSPEQVRKEEQLAELKRDTRYRKIAILLARARTLYHNKGIPMTVCKDDVLPKYQGESFIPKVCPVLKIELSYELLKGKRKHNDAVVGRMSARHEADAFNVTVMSHLARKLIEDTLTGVQKEKLLRELDCGAEWNKWKLAHE